MSSSGLFNFSDGSYFELRDILQGITSAGIGVNIVVAIIVITLAGIIWKYDESGYALTGYLIIAGILGVAIPGTMNLFFGVIAAMGVGMILYKIYDSRSSA